MRTLKLTERQNHVLSLLRDGYVLRRIKGQRTFHFEHEDGTNLFAGPMLNSSEVLRLQLAFLQPFDPVSGVKMASQPSVFGKVKVEFRLRAEDAPLP